MGEDKCALRFKQSWRNSHRNNQKQPLRKKERNRWNYGAYKCAAENVRMKSSEYTSAWVFLQRFNEKFTTSEQNGFPSVWLENFAAVTLLFLPLFQVKNAHHAILNGKEILSMHSS